MNQDNQVMTQTYEQKLITQGNRGLFSKKPFKSFETVMICEPIAMSVLSQYKNKMCNYCLQMKDLNRCSQCKVFYYCSSQCQRNDWKIHKLQCKSYAKMLTQKNLSPLKQIHTEFALNIRCWMIVQSDPIAKKQIQSMASVQQYQTAQKIQYFREMGVVICENFGIQKNQQNLTALFSIANRISINTFTLQDPLYNFDGIAIGIYYPANLLNHDCQANCTQIFDGKTLKILANKPIQKGTQLTISYTSILDDRNTRIQTLRTNYLFQCFCELCQVQKMIDTQTFYLLCPQCKSKSIIKEKKENDILQIKCNNCQKIFKSEQIKQLVQKINKYMEAVRTSQTYSVAKKNFFAAKKMCDFNHPAFARLIRMVYIQALNAACAVQGQAKQKLYEEAEILLNQELSKTKIWYRMDQEQQLNLVKIWQYAQLGKLAYNLKKLQKAYDYTEKAMQLAKYINYKQKFQQLKDLQRRFSEIKIELSLAKTKALK